MDGFRDYRYNIPGFFFLLSIAFYFVELSNIPNMVVDEENIFPTILGIFAGSLILYCFGYIPSIIGGSIAKYLTNRHFRNPPKEFDQKFIMPSVGKVKKYEKRIFIAIMQHSYFNERQLSFLTRRLTNIYVSINSIAAILLGILLSFCLWHNSDLNGYSSIEILILLLTIVILSFHATIQLMEFNRAVILFYDRWADLIHPEKKPKN